ncbi:PREDICTED: LOB domain-containing protein 42 [Tarenaya hassleriana]|uniref:LOB domain-containing protein 42 n=1 Tax=Tarenaya hassleriana TaxID=28532 RepID=UPI00053C7B5E|nr:PREDICTED: LOB domain-containing protein 42 [Tarenaya hassleriana]
MRISCNGCRVLRKGCNQECIIRPCLQWIKSPESQANATLFLAKFYGRAGLLNLIESGPYHLRPAIFKSLLYEACGRIVNPVDGSVGLMCSGNWSHCQAAVNAVLNGSSITHSPLPGAPASHQIIPPHKTFDIRHVAKDPAPDDGSSDTPRINKTKAPTRRFKRLDWSQYQLGESSRNAWPLETMNASADVHFDAGSALGFYDRTNVEDVGLELRLG